MVQDKKYKRTPSTWYKELPHGWRLLRLKRTARIFTGNSLNDDQKELYSKEPLEEYYVYLSSKNINVLDNSCNYDTGLKVPLSNIPLKVAPSGSTLLCVEGGSAGRKLTFTREPVCFVNKLACFVTNDSTLAKFLFYYLQSKEFKSHFENALSGLIGGVTISNLSNFEIPLPPLEVQGRIATLLDAKTGFLDLIIRKKRELLKQLFERKEALINQAITKGLKPDVATKDIGLRWLGEIPQHWDSISLGYLGSCQNGVSKGGDYFGEGFPFVSYGDVYNNAILPVRPKGLAQSSVEDQIAYSVIEGDVFFTRTSETVEEIGIASTCLETIENAVFSGFTIRFRPKSNLISKKFSSYFFRSSYVRTFFTMKMNLVTRASLSQGLLKSLKVLLPPIAEQEEISTYLDAQCRDIDAIIEKLKLQIERLYDFRYALISECVSGKSIIMDKENI